MQQAPFVFHKNGSSHPQTSLNFSDHSLSDRNACKSQDCFSLPLGCDPFLLFLFARKLLKADEVRAVMFLWSRKNISVDRACVLLHILGDIQCAQQRAAYEKRPFLESKFLKGSEKLCNALSYAFCMHACVLPVKIEKRNLHIVVAEPLKRDNMKMLKTSFQDVDIVVSFASRIDILHALEALQTKQIDFSPLLEGLEKEWFENPDTYETPQRFWQALFSFCHLKKISDLHVTPFQQLVRVEMRLDGVISPLFILPKAFWDPLLTCIKVMASLDVTQSRFPQTGRIVQKMLGNKMLLRCATYPSVDGEKVALRFLRHDHLALQDIGFKDNDLACMRQALHEPTGMVILGGPTGSGKTTTLHGMAKELVQARKMLVALEDTPEYVLPGAVQARIDRVCDEGKHYFSFEKGIKEALRQDVDALLVGEIRDAETAAMAVRAALTGHQVLTTVHASSVYGIKERLYDLGIGPKDLIQTWRLALYQRLVRVLCDACKKQNHENGFFEPVGCLRCQHTGYSGRTVIATVQTCDERFFAQRASVLTSFDSVNQDMLCVHAYEKVLAGITSLEEVGRVLGSAFQVFLEKRSKHQVALCS